MNFQTIAQRWSPSLFNCFAFIERRHTVHFQLNHIPTSTILIFFSRDSLIEYFLAKTFRTKITSAGNYAYFFSPWLIFTFLGTSWWSWYPFNDISTTATTISESECISSRLPSPRIDKRQFSISLLFPHSFRSQTALDVLMKWMNPCRCRSRNGIEIGKFSSRILNPTRIEHICCLLMSHSHQCHALDSCRWDVTDVCKLCD